MATISVFLPSFQDSECREKIQELGFYKKLGLDISSSTANGISRVSIHSCYREGSDQLRESSSIHEELLNFIYKYGLQWFVYTEESSWTDLFTLVFFDDKDGLHRLIQANEGLDYLAPDQAASYFKDCFLKAKKQQLA